MTSSHCIPKNACYTVSLIEGEVSERLKELVSKTSVRQRTVGSNPTLSAIH